eukprot:6266571-Amphidinium_carterae.1
MLPFPLDAHRVADKCELHPDAVLSWSTVNAGTLVFGAMAVIGEPVVSSSAETAFQACEVRASRRYFSTKDKSRVPLDSVVRFIPGEELLAAARPTRLR